MISHFVFYVTEYLLIFLFIYLQNGKDNNPVNLGPSEKAR